MSEPSQTPFTPLTLALISERTGFSTGGICKVIKRHGIKPSLVIGSLKFYSPAQAEQIAGLMLPFAKNK